LDERNPAGELAAAPTAVDRERARRFTCMVQICIEKRHFDAARAAVDAAKRDCEAASPAYGQPIPIADIGLERRLVEHLEALGLIYFDDLEAVAAEELLAVRGIGTAYFAAINHVLEKHGRRPKIAVSGAAKMRKPARQLRRIRKAADEARRKAADEARRKAAGDARKAADEARRERKEARRVRNEAILARNEARRKVKEEARRARNEERLKMKESPAWAGRSVTEFSEELGLGVETTTELLRSAERQRAMGAGPASL
jgi:hypothetical protein